MSENNDYEWMVRVGCVTFNHASYIEDAMNGFTMQQTNFPFVCTIIDDASTDGEQEVIKNYLKEHFDLEDKNIFRHEETDDYLLTYARHKTNFNCYFAVFFLKYNHYSIKKPKLPYIAEWNNNAKYIAWCEGDDYWIHKDKIQRQVSFLEANADYSMSCNRTWLFSVKKNRYVGEQYCYSKNNKLKTKDVINRGGLYISTTSIVYRIKCKSNYPEYCEKCAVGDYPLQIYLSLIGKVYYIDDIMSVYRIDNDNSFMGKNSFDKSSKKRMNVVASIVNLFKGLSKDFPAYAKMLEQKKEEYIISCYPNNKKIANSYEEEFKNEIRNFSLLNKIVFLLNRNGIPITKVLVCSFWKKYRDVKLIYNT